MKIASCATLTIWLLILSGLVQAHEATFYVVRHAEKQKGKDPLLTAAGMQRAQRISTMLEDRNLQAVYSTNYRRTIATATPTAAQAGIVLNIYDPAKPEDLITGLKGRFGTYLIVGHSNTVPELVALLSGKEVEAIDYEEYGQVFVVSIKSGKANFSETRSD